MASSRSDTLDSPTVTRDPRFVAGRTLVETGRANEGAVEIFATVLEETLEKYGETSKEAAICYYEYGNALFRAARLEQAADDDDDDNKRNTDEGASKNEARLKAAEAAQKRARDASDGDSKPAAKERIDRSEALSKEVNNDDEMNQSKVKEEANDTKGAIDNDDDDDEEEDDDVSLALEMMETAWSVLDKHVQDTNDPPSPWVLDQLPRFLLVIGDVLMDRERHADAADVYSRALDHRETAVKQVAKDDRTLDHLKKRRRTVEANVLVAEALLACPDGEDVVTTETNDVLVSAGERVEYARGYYDKARDELQETVFLMGRIAASGQDLGTEKEDVCFISTLLMGVGTTLAEYDEQKEATAQANAVHPNKRQKK